jgi:hypothetical protein
MNYEFIIPKINKYKLHIEIGNPITYTSKEFDKYLITTDKLKDITKEQYYTISLLTSRNTYIAPFFIKNKSYNYYYTNILFKSKFFNSLKSKININANILPMIGINASLFPIYKQFNRPNIKTLHLINKLQYCDVVMLNEYRKTKDNHTVLHFESMLSEEQYKFDKKYIKALGKTDYRNYNKETACDIDYSEFTDMDILILNIYQFDYKIRDLGEYRNLLYIFYILPHLHTILRSNGLMIIRFRLLDSKLAIDLLSILSRIFEKVIIGQPTLYYDQAIICENLKDSFYIDTKYIDKECGVQTNFKSYLQSLFIQNIDPILNVVRKCTLEYLKKRYNYTKEIRDIYLEYLKSPNILDQYILKAKSEAINFYTTLKIQTPLYLYYNKDDIYKLYKKYNESIKISFNDKYNNINIKNKYEIINNIKRQFDYIDDDSYYKIVKKLKLTLSIKNIIKNDINQAFLKMMEILTEFKLITRNITSFHTCEAPGMFIKAITYYCNKYDYSYDWHAQSLASGFGYHSDFLKNYKDRLFMQNNGDITNQKNILFYKQFFNNKKVDIFTSDCGVGNCDYSDEEILHLKVHFSQICCCLLTLKVGGSCVMKTFLPIQTKLGISIIYYLYKSFDELYFYKPSLNPISGEFYIVGKGYKGEKQHFSKLLKIQKSNDLSNEQILSVPKEFIDRLNYYIYLLLNNHEKALILYQLCFYYENIIDRTEYAKKWIKKYM